MGSVPNKKNFPLIFIQIAWVSELIAVLLYTMVIIPCLQLDKIELWLKFIPLFGTLIGAQGIAASGGPLLADRLKQQKENKSE